MVLACVAGLTAQAPAAEDQYLAYFGTATARHTAKFLYGEHHVLKARDGRLAERVVLYTCRDGTAFARKTVSYEDPLAPDFSFEDTSNGMQEGVRSAAKGREVFFRANRIEAEKAGRLPGDPGLVADAGFDEFIRMNWQPLMSGNPIALHFLVPSRLDAFVFQAQHLRSDSADGTPTEIFRLKLSGVLGWVLPGIDVSYGALDHVLVRYDGVSDLRDPSGNNFQTEILFHSSDRHPANAELVAAARKAPIAACK